jgi:hypothetical protein
MTSADPDALKYPIGRFAPPAAIGPSEIRQWIDALEALPDKVRRLVQHWGDDRLDTPYRPEGWTARQVVHHLADSHHNSYVRFKWALTEENPTIKAYDEKGWAGLFDSRTAPIALSLDHLQAVHAKLVYLLRGLGPEELGRTFVHPESRAETRLDENIGRYAWHGNHHLAHLRSLKEREGWD